MTHTGDAMQAMKLLEPCYYFRLGEKYYHVISRDFLVYEYEFPVIDAKGESDKITIEALEPEKGEVYVFSIGVFQKGVSIEVYQPPATGRFGAKGYVATIDHELSPAEEPNEGIVLVTAFGRSIALRARNELEVAIAPRIRAVGMKYKVEEVTDPAKIRELESMFREGRIPELIVRYGD